MADGQLEANEEAFLDDFGIRLTSFANQLASGIISPKQWKEMQRIGRFWGHHRRKRGVSLHLICEHTGLVSADYLAFEIGMLSFKDLATEFLPQLATALGKPELLDQFIQEHGHLAEGKGLLGGD